MQLYCLVQNCVLHHPLRVVVTLDDEAAVRLDRPQLVGCLAAVPAAVGRRWVRDLQLRGVRLVRDRVLASGTERPRVLVPGDVGGGRAVGDVTAQHGAVRGDDHGVVERLEDGRRHANWTREMAGQRVTGQENDRQHANWTLGTTRLLRHQI